MGLAEDTPHGSDHPTVAPTVAKGDGVDVVAGVAVAGYHTVDIGCYHTVDAGGGYHTVVDGDDAVDVAVFRDERLHGRKDSWRSKGVDHSHASYTGEVHRDYDSYYDPYRKLMEVLGVGRDTAC